MCYRLVTTLDIAAYDYFLIDALRLPFVLIGVADEADHDLVFDVLPHAGDVAAVADAVRGAVVGHGQVAGGQAAAVDLHGKINPIRHRC